MVTFRGLEPWPPGVEVIEVIVGGQVVDLHNDAMLTAIEIACLPAVEVTLRFRVAERRIAALTFAAVTELSFRQDPDDAVSPFAESWRPEDVETFHGVQFEDAGDGTGRFEVGTITGTLSFVAESVSFDRSALGE